MPEVTGSPGSSTPVDMLASFRSEIDEMSPSIVLTPRVDVSAAALIAIGSMPEIEAHRALIASVFGEASGGTLDRLVPVARALMTAQGALSATTERDLEPMARELMEVRTRLFLAASALIERELVSRRSLSTLIGGQSYQARVKDTITLDQWFRALPREVRAQTRVTDAELVAARAMADEFGTAFANREQARTGSSPAEQDRARMFTLFFRTYERVRKMLTYVRWHEGDVEEIAPSIYSGRGARKSDGVGFEPRTEPPVVSPGLPGADPFRVT